MGEIIDEFEKCFLKKFKMKKETETNDFALFELNNQLSSKLFKVNNISTQNYIPDLLKKYYLELPVENWIVEGREQERWQAQKERGTMSGR